MFNVFDSSGSGPESKYINFSSPEEKWLTDTFDEEDAMFFKFHSVADKPNVYILEHICDNENKWISFSEFGIYINALEKKKENAMLIKFEETDSNLSGTFKGS